MGSRSDAYVVTWTRDARDSTFRPTGEETARGLCAQLAGLDGTEMVTLSREGAPGLEIVFCAHLPQYVLTWLPGAGTTRYEIHRDRSEYDAAVDALEALIAEGDPITWTGRSECQRCHASL